MHVLIIEDTRDLAANLIDYLGGCGHTVDTAMDGVTGLRMVLTGEFDAIVLDLGLPGMDGTQVCEELRKAGCTVPVVMLTGRGDLEQRVEGLELGADDYLVKPVALRELEARLRALVRRATAGAHAPVLQVGDLALDERTMSVTRAQLPITRTRRDYELLRALMRASPAVVSRARLERALWGDEPPNTDALRTHIHTLRRAIDKPFEHKLLHTVHAFGYRLAADDALSR
ncbi:MAG: response regulator transcription factor [Gammaproteobacteria bacterium]|nr:response regulator transcription factor [Gammaproteobacteria bacterium]